MDDSLGKSLIMERARIEAIARGIAIEDEREAAVDD
jgi:hypothetical protein